MGLRDGLVMDTEPEEYDDPDPDDNTPTSPPPLSGGDGPLLGGW